MPIALRLNVQAHEGTLMLTDRAGKTVTFSKEHTVQQQVSRITLGEFCGLPTRHLATCCGFQTRTSSDAIRHTVLHGSPADLLPTRLGPHTPSKRTQAVEALLIRTRCETDRHRDALAAALPPQGCQVSARRVGQVLADEELDRLAGTCQPRARVVTRHDLAPDGTALLPRGLTTTSAGGGFFLPALLPLGAHDLAAPLGPPTHDGLPPERLALGLVCESLVGSKIGRASCRERV